MSIFDDIPNEIIREMALSLRLKDIKNFGLTNSRFNQTICKDDEFWHQKFIRDYGNSINSINSIKYRKSWKEMYQRHGMIWIWSLSNIISLDIKYIKNIMDITVPTRISDLKAKQVSSAKNHTVFIDFENNVWGYGKNNCGQLGIKSRGSYVAIPQQIEGFKSKQVSTGYSHTLFIDMNNNVRACGDNDCGELGIGHENAHLHPALIRNIKAREISAGARYSVIIDMDNNVWVWGNNYHGQLGLGHNKGRNSPTQIPNFKAIRVSAGISRTVSIDRENNVWTCGKNRYRFRGESEEYSILGLSDNKNRYIPMQIPNFKAKQVSTGEFHTLFIDLEDNVWSCGSNRWGQLGLGDDNIKNVTRPQMIPNINLLGKAQQVLASGGSTFIIDFDNNVWTCGYNGYHQPLKSLTQIPNINLLGKARQVSAGFNYTVILE